MKKIRNPFLSKIFSMFCVDSQFPIMYDAFPLVIRGIVVYPPYFGFLGFLVPNCKFKLNLS